MHNYRSRRSADMRYGVRASDCGCNIPYRESRGGCGESRMSDSCLCDSQPISLAMAYIKDQPYECLYSSAEAICRGTLFSALDMPKCEKGGNR